MSDIKLRPASEKDRAAQQKLEKMVSGGKRKKLIRGIALGAAALAAAGWFILRPKLADKGTERPAGIIDRPVERRDLTVTISGSGALAPADSYNIIGLVGGEVLSADFEEGDYVNKDDLLYRIDSKDAEKSIEQAKLNLESAGLTYQAAVDSAKELSVKSKAAGKISRLYVKAGDDVTVGMPIADISNTDVMLLKVNFHSADADLIAVGSPAVITMTETGETVYGSVKSVSTITAVGVGGTLMRQAEINVPNPGGIAPGSSAAASVNGVACAEAGMFEPVEAATVTSSSMGKVGSLRVSEGDTVQEGQVLLVLSSDSSKRQIESAELGVRSARLALESSQSVLDNYLIKSPISGTVVEKNTKAGDTLDATRPGAMAVIYDMSYLTLTLNIDELDIGSLQVGQRVELEAEALPGERFEGYVERVGVNGAVAAGVTTYPVKVRVTDYRSLLPGMNVTAEIMIETVKGALTVPVSAVSRGGTVLAVDPESKGDTENGVPPGYRRVEVETGRIAGDYIEIVSGLSDSDTVGIDTTTTSLIEQMINVGGGRFGE